MITTPTNIDYLIVPVQMHVGDIDGTIFTYSTVRTAITFGVKSLQSRWNNRYFVYASGMRIDNNTIMTPDGKITVDTLPNENDIFRNLYSQTFLSSAPPIIDQTDEPAIVLSAAIILRRVVLTSSFSAFGSWSTPDLSYSNIQSNKHLLTMLEEDKKSLDRILGGFKLATPQKDTIQTAYVEPVVVSKPTTEEDYLDKG